MPMTIETLSRYLGQHASVLLADPPFKDWAFERSFTLDLPELEIDYIFADNGLDFISDEYDNVSTIFIYADKQRYFTDGLADMPFSTTRRDVIARLGAPAASGRSHSHPILGQYGPWDRFACPRYSIHIEYRLDDDCIRQITLMRPDAVPPGIGRHS